MIYQAIVQIYRTAKKKECHCFEKTTVFGYKMASFTLAYKSSQKWSTVFLTVRVFIADNRVMRTASSTCKLIEGRVKHSAKHFSREKWRTRCTCATRISLDLLFSLSLSIDTKNQVYRETGRKFLKLSFSFFESRIAHRIIDY